MNPIYSVLESPHRWSILAGLSLLAACVGAIAMIAYNWPHTLALIWFYLGAILTLVFLVQAFRQWRADVETVLEGPVRPSSGGRDRPSRPVGEQPQG